MSIHRTIRREREARKWSMEDLAARISAAEGLPKPLAWQTVQQWEREGGTAPKRKRMEVVAELFGMSVAELLGEAPALRRHSNVGPGPDIRGLVPLISWVRAGSWCEASDPLQPGDAEEWLPCPAAHSPGTFALRVRGDSMTAPHGNSRTYPEGCIIFVDPERKSPVNGDRVVACLVGQHEVTFKIYKNEDGRQWLQPLNPSHEPIREAFHVLGTVIGKWEPE
ncbi:XRE family transcriptional regulator [Pulveribacter sp.]|uniref:helix-turn-helix domain-containing protein n=1 Tax=Pulveribacter sp. TaxID=2678893 RepID=UPI00289AEDC1|nr:XRE family transcriptional regulator [Pulveribacter sp.]